MSNSSLQEIVCCIGHPVAGNPTQFVMEKAFAKAGLEWRYLTLEVAPEQLADAVRGIRAMGFRGGNFVAPHRRAAIELLDEVSEEARLAESVSCVWRRDDRLIGDNTSGKGFLAALATLADAADPREKKVVICGAGEMARSIGVELGRAGAAEITIVCRNAERGQALADTLSSHLQVAASCLPWEGDFQVPDQTQILVHATSIGAGDFGARPPLALGTLQDELVVADVTFHPFQTRLLRDAQERGCRTVDGLSMLLEQARIDFHHWTGLSADMGVMREALEEFLGW